MREGLLTFGTAKPLAMELFRCMCSLSAGKGATQGGVYFFYSITFNRRSATRGSGTSAKPTPGRPRSSFNRRSATRGGGTLVFEAFSP